MLLVERQKLTITEANRLAESNLGLCHSAVRRATVPYFVVGKDDQYQIARMAIVLAARNHDERLAKFSTLAVLAAVRAIRAFGEYETRAKRRGNLYARGGESTERLASADHVASRISDREIAEVAMGSLGKNEKLIVRRYIMQGETLMNIGRSLGISHEGVRQIAKRAISRMRAAVAKAMRTGKGK